MNFKKLYKLYNFYSRERESAIQKAHNNNILDFIMIMIDILIGIIFL